MFRENSGHIQENLFGTTSQLSAQQQKRLEKSKEYFLYEHFFSQIDETIFRPLYFENNGRPNAAINALVTGTVLQSHRGWSVEFLIDQINFNLLTRTALGMKTIDGVPFCEATYYNFQNRLRRYYEQTGNNLLEEQFQKLTKKQLKALELKTDIQRIDSFQVLSNIKSRSRVELLVEVVIRLYRSLDLSQQEQICNLVAPYLSESSERYMYHLSKEDIPHELSRLAELYYSIYTTLGGAVSDLEEYQTFARVFEEQFVVKEKKITIKAPAEVGSSSLQSPDDLDATYRTKRNESYQGYVAAVTETASLENEVNLITDVVLYPNNVDDAAILKERIDSIKEASEELKELHADGGFGSSTVDTKLEELDISMIQTAVKGREASVAIEVRSDERTQEITVSCPLQTVTAVPARKRMKAEFPLKLCETCPLADSCPTQKKKKYRVFRFDKERVLADKRKMNIRDIPPERRTIRANVEATVKQFSSGFNHCGKLKTRGIFNAALYVIASAFSINIGRIFRYQLA